MQEKTMTQFKQFLTKISDSSSTKKNKKVIFLAVFASLVIVAAIIGIVAGVNSSSDHEAETNSHHAIVKSACSSTFYPDLCFSAVAATTKKVIRSQKDVIELSLNITTTAVEHNYFTIKKLLGKKQGSLTEREKTALHDCLETIDETLEELHQAVKDLHLYPNEKSLKQHADDLKTLMSAAMTNQETCLDGFSHEDADKKIRQALVDGEKYVEKMCSNALAMIKNMTDTDIANYEHSMMSSNRKLKEVEEINGIAWPEWLSAGDRRLLQSTSTSVITPDVVVAADGSGNYTTVSEAVAEAPQKSNKRYVIKIKAGVYRENVEVPKKKTNIMFVGEGRTKTIITGSRNVVDGSTTFHSATVGNYSISIIFCFIDTSDFFFLKKNKIKYLVKFKS